ncbi:IS66 family insertion sequence element accessory protein TnpB [Rhizobium ruizarguesonis]|uniref:IS66 family insertion sequence element accessory protein TnpB n=1 Tax=Rhizobium ruizarguesonis TaxID=2081791 RepID=UPI0013EEE501|nr:IS66 family insertion sequence element accessory protein TnpB [Rhizobium ruizarguesonis]
MDLLDITTSKKSQSVQYGLRIRSHKADRLKLIYLDGSGLVMAYKRLEEHTFTWPGIKDGLMTMGDAQFEALFAGLDRRRVCAVEARGPDAIE